MAKQPIATSILAKVLAAIEYEGGNFRKATILDSIPNLAAGQKSDLTCQAAELLALLVQKEEIEAWCDQSYIHGFICKGAVERFGHAVHNLVQHQFSAMGRKYQELWGKEAIVQHILVMLLDKGPHLNQKVLTFCLMSFANLSTFKPRMPYELLLRCVAKYLDTDADAYGLVVFMKKLEQHLQTETSKKKAARSLTIQAAQIIKQHGANVALPPLEPEDLWAEACLIWYLQQSPGLQAKWLDFLTFVATAKASKPSKKWLKTATSLMAAIGEEAYLPLLEWLGLVGEDAAGCNIIVNYNPTIMKDQNAVMMKGIVWALACQPEKQVSAALGKCAATCFHKIPQHGPRSVKVGNACVLTLASLNTLDAIAELTRLQSRVKHPSTLKTINKALMHAAERKGMSTDELAELAVPTFNLQPEGSTTIQMGDFKAHLTVLNSQTIHLTWLNAHGKSQKTVPKPIKETMPGELKALKQKIKELKACLAVQKIRIERLLTKNYQWDFQTWKNRYVDHPLVGVFAKKLIWTFHFETHAFTAMPLDSRLVDHQGISQLPDGACKVSLWHPVDVNSEDVLKWRSFIQNHQITQPIKQAYREIYLLTDAERQTQTYSNRFAAHILNQHQLLALCQQRGWQYSLMGDFDAFHEPTIHLPDHGLKVALGITAARQEAENLSESGIFLSVTSDQVSFVDHQSLRPRNLDTIPKRVFSESMRDVDLFISVCSLGNDPNWQDHTQGSIYHDYCQTYNLDELSEMGKTRRAVLETIIPQLSFAEKCTLEDCFLLVEGRIRTYKINIGSANVFMQPNNQYLCIVPVRQKKRSSSTQIFLPFEGDATLALILSKARLLAADEKIKDPIILSQIHRS